MMVENLDDVLFYSLEKAIKTYRQYAQRKIAAAGFDITIDQWLILKTLDENPQQTQHQIADGTFKDYASLTRIIELLVKKGYLERTMHPDDRRRFLLTTTTQSKSLLKNLTPLLNQNRHNALKNITQQQAASLRDILNTIINNCKA